MNSREMQYIRLLNNPNMADTVIECTDGKCWAIWFILVASGAKFFKTQNESNFVPTYDENKMRIITVPFKEETMKNVLSFIYIGSFSEITDTVSLIYASDFFVFSELTSEIVRLLKNEPHRISPDDLLDSRLGQIVLDTEHHVVPIILLKKWWRWFGYFCTKNRNVGATISPNAIIYLFNISDGKTCKEDFFNSIQRHVPLQVRQKVLKDKNFSKCLYNTLDRVHIHAFLTLEKCYPCDENDSPDIDLPNLTDLSDYSDYSD